VKNEEGEKGLYRRVVTVSSDRESNRPQFQHVYPDNKATTIMSPAFQRVSRDLSRRHQIKLEI
jgi:hypothetical protein